MNRAQARQRRQPRASRRTATNTKPPPNKFIKVIQSHIPVILGGAVLAGLIIRAAWKRANRPEAACVPPQESSNEDIPKPWNLGPALCTIPAVAEFLARQAQLNLPDLNGPQKAIVCPIDDGVGSGIDNGASVAPKPWTKGGNLQALFEALSSSPLPGMNNDDQGERPEPIGAKPGPIETQDKPLSKNPSLKDLIEAAIALHGHPILSEAADPVQWTAVTVTMCVEEQKAQDSDGAQAGDDLAGCKGECETANSALQEGPLVIGDQVDLPPALPEVERQRVCLARHIISDPYTAEEIRDRLKAFGGETGFMQQRCPPCRESPGRFMGSLASSLWRPKVSKRQVSARQLCSRARGPPVIDTSCGKAGSAT